MFPFLVWRMTRRACNTTPGCYARHRGGGPVRSVKVRDTSDTALRQTFLGGAAHLNCIARRVDEVCETELCIAHKTARYSETRGLLKPGILSGSPANSRRQRPWEKDSLFTPQSGGAAEQVGLKEWREVGVLRRVGCRCDMGCRRWRPRDRCVGEWM